MAQKAIREFTAKQLLYHYLPLYLNGFNQKYQGIAIDADDVHRYSLPGFQNGYVAKPDELFGKRGKNNLIYLSDNADDILRWIRDKSAQTVTVLRGRGDRGISGKLKTFLVEPKVAHTGEYYVAISAKRTHNELYLSESGGVDVEDNWDKVITVQIPFSLEAKPLSEDIRKELWGRLQSDNRDLLIDFASALHQVFSFLDFTYLEINPLVIEDGQYHLLDCVARLDDTAEYMNETKWAPAQVDFPKPFGTSDSEAERKIEKLDAKSGASLKLKILNPNGSIWMLTSGGGGSVIFADTVGDLGFADRLANYGEYSGNPTTDETEAYADIVLTEMAKSSAKKKVLIIGGGIANFTDVKKTFTGVISALKKHESMLKKDKVKIFVRRGGPNYEAGLSLIRNAVTAMGLPIEVYGPETYMTAILAKATQALS
ncbi:MAG: Succinyl-CoA ligase (ADP-forming) subunit beta [candidate division WS6 bacterium OLB20]|uniref:Succinyl-CoA ligase (ADP-forming) subunit beta n=1 Tax=candidate division WS6 bacterium OLB20 TaxID=1617426 RepID=A0A136LW11_9BACT|nr:MAG: Succinyl-CoA ligase (ADP-forming) subunit beta [candidate division WS6 bacterium OLB20]